MKTDYCRSCGKDIVWGVSPAGKKIPLDADPEMRFFFQEDVALSDSGELVGAVKTYQSHFATCPNAEEWRGGSRGEG